MPAGCNRFKFIELGNALLRMSACSQVISKAATQWGSEYRLLNIALLKLVSQRGSYYWLEGTCNSNFQSSSTYNYIKLAIQAILAVQQSCSRAVLLQLDFLFITCTKKQALINLVEFMKKTQTDKNNWELFLSSLIIIEGFS